MFSSFRKSYSPFIFNTGDDIVYIISLFYFDRLYDRFFNLILIEFIIKLINFFYLPYFLYLLNFFHVCSLYHLHPFELFGTFILNIILKHWIIIKERIILEI